MLFRSGSFLTRQQTACIYLRFASTSERLSCILFAKTMSGNYGEPDWLTPGSTGATAASTNFDSSQQNAAGGMPAPAADNPEKNAKCVQILLSLMNITVCALMTYLGVEGIISMNFGVNFDQFSWFFVTIYMFVFAGILLMYEIVWWTKLKSVNRSLRKNFGFMYGIRGKGLFLIFVAFLTVGFRGHPTLELLMYATGGSWLAVGILHIFLFYFKPNLVSSYKSPTAGFTDVGTAV